MGLFKQMKDMKNVIHEAPGVLADAQVMAAQAQQMGAAQQLAAQQMLAQQQAASADLGAAAIDDREAIEGVTLQDYARLSKAIVGQPGLDQAGIDRFVTTQGITPEAWSAATDGWNARMKGNMSLATRYGALYTQA